MHLFISPMSQRPTPTDYSPSPRTPDVRYESNLKHFTKVNPNLLIQWQGQSKSDTFLGSGIFKVSERSKDITKKGNLIFSLEADQWKNNKPVGDIKMLIIHYYEDKGPKGIVKQVRKYEGGCQQLCKHGHGQYTIEYHYSNETRDIVCISGEWENDFIKNGTITKDGRQRKDINFEHNIEMDQHKAKLSRKTLLAPLDRNQTLQRVKDNKMKMKKNDKKQNEIKIVNNLQIPGLKTKKK